MNLSFWEYKQWFTAVDFTIVGSGIVGLSCAWALRERFPNAKILVLEKGLLPEGASTKNAGFACFGSISELVDDLTNSREEDVVNLVSKRWNGLQLLRKTLGDTTIDFKPYGGYEVFLKTDTTSYETCIQKLPFINELLFPIFKTQVFSKEVDRFAFHNTNEYLIFNPFEAQIDTGKMMHALLQKVQERGVMILNNFTVEEHHENSQGVTISGNGITFSTNKLLYATNGFASKVTNNQVKPGRAQVLITEPIPDLDIKGTFHLDKGYYYFRNIDTRILLGGGRNLDFEGETTTEFGTTATIQDKLEALLREVILPNQDVKIAQRWSGIMGLGSAKNPIVEPIGSHVYCGVRLGGMGVAIGSLVGRELADLIEL